MLSRFRQVNRLPAIVWKMANPKTHLFSPSRSRRGHQHGLKSSINLISPSVSYSLLLLLMLTVCHHIPNANSQPLLNQLAVYLRARPPWPTSFPATAQQQNNLQHQQHQQIQSQLQQLQSPSSLPQQIPMQSNHVYPTSSVPIQNFMASNNFIASQGPLSQGMPFVAMDPSQSSITIMNPAGSEQIMAHSPSGMGGNGVLIAQPFQQQEHFPVLNGSVNSNKPNLTTGGTDTTDSASNGNGYYVQNGFPNVNENNIHSTNGGLFQLFQNQPGHENQNLIDGNVFHGSAGIHQQPHLATGNIPHVNGHVSFHNEQQQEYQVAPPQQQIPPGFIVHNQPPNNVNNQAHSNSNNPSVPPAESLPPPPPIPVNFKGPAIIAVPKVPQRPTPVMHPAASYLGPMETNLQQLSNTQPGGTNGGATQPIIIHSFHQLPNLTPAFPQLLPQSPHMHGFSQEHLISLPENAILNLELNKTNAMADEFSQKLSPNFQPSHQQQEHYEHHHQQNDQPADTPIPQQEHQPETNFVVELPRTEISDFIGTTRHPRKRHQKQRQQQHHHLQATEHEENQYDQHTTEIFTKINPTARPTQIPFPSESEHNENEIDTRPASISDYSLSTIVNLPSTTVTGSFEYPDPPTPPNFESMNALKYPSPFTDSAEVAVKHIPMSKDTSKERRRIGDELREQLKSALHLHNSPISDIKRERVRPTTTVSTTGHQVTLAESSNKYDRVTTLENIPETNGYPGERETTTFFVPSTQARSAATFTTKRLKKDKHKRKGKSGKVSRGSFRPSPQIHSFEEPVTGIKSYITILPPVTSALSSDESKSAELATHRAPKSLPAKFEASESKNPPYEAGFKPVSHYTTYKNGKGIPAPSTTTETLYFDLIREVVSKAPGKQWSEPDLNLFRETQTDSGKLTTTQDALGTTWESSYKDGSNGRENFIYTTIPNSKSSTDGFTTSRWKVKDNFVKEDDGKRQVTTSASSERVENWRFPDTTDSSKESSKIYFGNGKFGPPNCDKFHRFGFCPMNSGYPTDQVEKIASRCSALLSHLIAPLPKADVRYDVIVSKNGSMLKGKSTASSGWSWKSFSGKPVCDTKEIKVVPGWAKNEQGEWLVILQTKAWKQEAQITLCTPRGTHYNCKGNKTSTKNGDDCTPSKIKCVQRFTAQRLAVLDPENTDRCPVLRSVFLPSACVCLNDNSPPKARTARVMSTSEEMSASSSEASIVKINSKTSKSSSSKSKSKKGSKGKKNEHKKIASSKRNKKSSSKSRNLKKSVGNTSTISSSEEHENRSDIPDSAADLSTHGTKKAGKAVDTRKPHHEEDSLDLTEESTSIAPTPGASHSSEDKSEEEQSQIENDEDENEDGEAEQNSAGESSNEEKIKQSNVSHSKKKSKKSSKHEAKNEEDHEVERVTSTVTSNSHSGSGTVATEDSSGSEESDEKKAHDS